jgi:hypothetical protein
MRGAAVAVTADDRIAAATRATRATYSYAPTGRAVGKRRLGYTTVTLNSALDRVTVRSLCNSAVIPPDIKCSSTILLACARWVAKPPG